VILVYNKHNISVTRVLVIITGTLCTTNSMASTFNQTINYKNSLTIGCLMGVNLRIIKPESPIILAHVTSLLATQC
jgi:hypothetical protein